MSIDTDRGQGTELYSLDRAMHEVRYVYGVIAAMIAVRIAIDESQTRQAQASSRFKEIMGTSRFGRQTISELQQNLALSEIDIAHQVHVIRMNSNLRQLNFLGEMAMKREQQAQQDWLMRSDVGFDVLLEDTSHLLPMPGEAALTQFGIDYLGDPPGPTRSEADIPFMQSILPSDPK
jgi:hypothetical protein